ncbi:MAG: hypothetical protein WD267_05075 [Balneolales bacterium]
MRRYTYIPSIKHVYFVIAMMIMSLSWYTHEAEAQALNIISSNTFAGAFTGAMLGGAQMALNNDEDLTPLRYGVGFGTLAGLGIGAYDTGREAEYLYGTFRRTRHTGTVIMMDTFLGSATGAVVGMAVALIRNDEIVEGLQYGAGAGAWAGFGFGLIDGFFLSEYNEQRYGSTAYHQSSDAAQGLLTLQYSTGLSVGFVNPAIYSFPELHNQDITIQNRFGLELTNFSLTF